MGLGVLEDRVLDHVPGTTRYFDDPSRPQVVRDGTIARQKLKTDNSGPEPIILIPQPSDDPNDPLNWPLWKRDLITFILSITAIFATALGPVLAAETVPISTTLRSDFTAVALLTGYFLLGVGVAAFFFVPSGRIWGKRHLFIIGTIILILSSVWAGISARDGARLPGKMVAEKHDYYRSVLGARIVQGVGCAPFESLVNAAIGDLYFVHQRGKRMAFTNLAVFGGAFFTPVLAGKISVVIGWWWNFWFIAIFCFVCMVAVVLFCPETAYKRDESLNTDICAPADVSGNMSYAAELSAETTAETESGEAREASRDAADKEMKRPDGWPTTSNLGAIPPKQSWVQSMALFNGRKTDETFWKLLLRPLPLFFQPAFLWACLIQGTLIGWTVFIGAILGALFLGPPLWWGAEKTGYTYVGAFVGAVVGFIISGTLSDWSAKKMTKMNGGIYEPEFRIVMVIPQLILGAIGLYGIGYASESLFKNEVSYLVPVTFFGFEVAAMVIGAVASSLYIVDAYRDLSIEAFTCMIIFKNIFGFALTWKAFDWIVMAPTVVPLFLGVASVHVAVCLTSIPMYVYGKRNRSFFHRHDILKLTGLR